MKIEIDLKKTLDENAREYFKKSKLEKKRIKGLNVALSKQKERKKKNVKEEKLERKKKWFEKYRWFITTNNLLVIGGKTAIQNEEIVKKHMKKDDYYFHADLQGAPHCVVKLSENKKLKSVPEESKIEAAIFAASFSSAFDKGISVAESYAVTPEQVSKRAPSGMSMGTGAFMIYGEREYFKKTPLDISIGYFEKEGILMCGPTSAIKKWCKNVIKLSIGSLEKNKAAKLLKEKFKEKGLKFMIDEILSLLPNGSFEIKL